MYVFEYDTTLFCYYSDYERDYYLCAVFEGGGEGDAEAVSYISDAVDKLLRVCT